MSERALDRVFNLQEKVLQRNIVEFSDRFNFISNCIDLLVSPGISEEQWDSIDPVKRTIFNYFFGDSTSTLISSVRLALHGCETDALALMRIVLETLTIFDYINSEELYNLALTEIVHGTGKGKSFTDKLSYETAIKKLGIVDRRERLRGYMSSAGAHATPNRIARSRYTTDGKDHVKIGLSISHQRVDITLGELSSLVLFAVRVADEFFEKTSNDLIFHNKRLSLDEEYTKLEKSGN